MLACCHRNETIEIACNVPIALPACQLLSSLASSNAPSILMGAVQRAMLFQSVRPFEDF
jgi:hypothetical protein